MLSDKNINIIAKNIVKIVKKNYEKIDNFDQYVIGKIKEERKKINLKKNKQKSIIYDGEFDPQNDNNINIIFEDFDGKNERLNVFNSCENVDIVEETYKNINYMNYMFYRKMLFNINCFISNLFYFSKKNILTFLMLFINYFFLIFYNFSITMLFSLLNIINCLVFKIFKFFLYIKYKIFKRHLNFLNIFLNIIIFVLREILIILKEVSGLLSKVFSMINDIIGFSNKKIKNNLYFKITNNKVNRDERSNEHKNILNKVNEKAREIFRRYNSKNKDYYFTFSKANCKPLKTKNIENEVLKEYVKTLRQYEIKEIETIVKKSIGNKIKDKIYRKEINFRMKNLGASRSKIINYEKNINKYLKKKFKDNNIVKDIFNENIEKGI